MQTCQTKSGGGYFFAGLLFALDIVQFCDKLYGDRNFEESTINTIHQQSGFDQLYIEKVLRLLGDRLRFFTFYKIK